MSKAYLEMYAEWRQQTLQKAERLCDIIRKQKQELTDALREVQQSIPAVRAVLFVTLACQGFFKQWLGYEPKLDLTEQEIIGG